MHVYIYIYESVETSLSTPTQFSPFHISTPSHLGGIEEMLLDPARNDHYNIMTALRGPDSEDLDLKFMTTAVVRHFAGVDPNSGAFVYTPEQAKTLWAAMPDEAKARISKSIYFSHFHCHVSTALLSLGTPEAFDYRDWLFAQRILTRWTI